MIRGQTTGVLLIYFLIITCVCVCVSLCICICGYTNNVSEEKGEKVVCNGFREKKCERRHDTLTARKTCIKMCFVAILETVSVWRGKTQNPWNYFVHRLKQTWNVRLIFICIEIPLLIHLMLIMSSKVIRVLLRTTLVCSSANI